MKINPRVNSPSSGCLQNIGNGPRNGPPLYSKARGRKAAHHCVERPYPVFGKHPEFGEFTQYNPNIGQNHQIPDAYQIPDKASLHYDLPLCSLWPH